MNSTLEPLEPRQITDVEDILVLGGGVAGMAAALWCWRLGHGCLLVDAGPELGGQLHLVHNLMPDLAGMEPMNGETLARRLRGQFAQVGGRWLRSRVASASAAEELARVELVDGAELRARALVVALGVRRRCLGVPGEQELTGRGLLATAAKGTDALAGKRVVVVGSGDAACENVIALARQDARVTLVHRRAQLSARRQLVRALHEEPRIVLQQAQVLRFVGHDRLERVVVEGEAGERALPAEAALVRIGWIPNSEMLPTTWRDRRGFLRADQDGRVAAERAVFGAGDLLGRLCPSVATSVGSAAIAARAAVAFLESAGSAL
jgi:thioredoxin reductase (NADPH)